jgi:hypothetical protein
MRVDPEDRSAWCASHDLRRGRPRPDDGRVRTLRWALATGAVCLAASARADQEAEPRGASPPDELRAHAADVVDYTLSASLDPAAHVVHATGTIRWRNTSSKPVSELWLHLYLNAFKDDRSDFLRERVGGRGSAPMEGYGQIDVRSLALHNPDAPPDDLLPTIEVKRPGSDDETDARVPLPRDVRPDEAITLDVAFDDRLPIVVERTGYRGSFHMVGQWFPKVARLEPDGTWAHFTFHHLSEFYADFGAYDVTLDVPEAFTIGATGPAVETRVTGGRRVERHVQRDVHDFAWTAWDEWQSRRDVVDAVAVTVLYPPGFGAVAERDLEAVRYALPDDSARYGRYPYATLTVVHPPQEAAESGGMEYPTLITGDGPWLTPRRILEPEIVAVHELGHQWFYGLVATNEAAWPFLDEGVNQFAEGDTMARWRGPGCAVDLLGLRVSDAAIQAVGGNLAARDEPVAQAASAFSTGANYGRLVYARTASVLETLRRVYGDAAVAQALGRYTRRFRFEHPGPDQFVEVFEEVLGPAVAATLRAALFDKGWVDFAVDRVRSERLPNGGDYESSALVRRRGPLVFPVEVELFFADGSRRREPWDGRGDWKLFELRGPVALSGVVVDPDDRVAIDANLENNHASTPDGGGRARSTLERLTYWMQLALQVLSP